MYSAGSKTKHKTGDGNNNNNNSSSNNNNQHSEGEVLDLRDLDLSQLRLTKKDLETLSSITPSLSKNLQEQLLAQLPPNQAKKLSRTLSVQGSNKTAADSTQSYRRSMSNNPKEIVNRYSRDSITPTNEAFDSINNNNNSQRYRRSASRDVDDDRFEDSVNNNFTSSHHHRDGALSPDDFRGQYYSSLKNTKPDRKSMDKVRLSTSPQKDFQRTCFSPPPPALPEHNKRFSRFLSPDSNGYEHIYDEPRKIDRTTTTAAAAARELETHKILKEIHDKKREKSAERDAVPSKENRISYLLDKYSAKEIAKHLQNGNFSAITPSRSDTANSNHSHSSVSSSINDKILNELNSISLLNNQLEKFDHLEVHNQEKLKKKTKVKVEAGAGGETVKKLVRKVKEKTPDFLDDEPSLREAKAKRESKISRPKSFSSKESAALKHVRSSEELQPDDRSEPLTEPLESKVPTASKLARPKSFPNSKITAPKEVKKFPDSLANILNTPHELTPPLMKEAAAAVSQKVATSSTEKLLSQDNVAEPKKTKKVIKVVKKSSKTAAAATTTAAAALNSNDENLAEPTAIADVNKEKSPEKKSGGKGLLYTIGQKFEKLREPKKDKDKKAQEAKEDNAKEVPAAQQASSSTLDMKEKKKKLKAMLSEDVDEATRQERKSKIDAMIKNLKEKSLPHNTELTESGLIKRAVSVEEMPNTFNKNTVNKVLGLFKRIEKDNAPSKTTKVQNTKSTSFLCTMEASSSSDDYITIPLVKERPKSSGFVNNNKLKKTGSTFEPLKDICESKIPIAYTCPDCKEPKEIVPSKSSSAVTKRHSNDQKTTSIEEKERLKNNRKGLMLDLDTTANGNSNGTADSSLKKPTGSSSKAATNNYSFPPPLPQEINHNQHNSSSNNGSNLLTPTYDSLTNYSSSPYDESTNSNLMSPTDDHDIYYDGWSTCSDEQHTLPPPHHLGSSSFSRLSRSAYSQAPGQNDSDDPPESVVDRIRRKSFYSRFNEKKPKRVSNIVGPAAKDYYRDRSRPLEYTKSATSIIPDLSDNTKSSGIDVHSHRSTSRYPSSTTTSAHRSLSQSRTASSKYSSDKPSDTLQHSSSFRRLNHESSSHLSSLPPPPHHHHHHYHHDMLLTKTPPEDISLRYKSNRNTMYDSSSSSSNTTPSLSSIYAKRRSYVSTPSSSSGTTTLSSSALKPPLSYIDGYATVGRKTRQYNARSVSLLDSNIINTTSSYSPSTDHHRSVLNGYGSSDLNGSASRFVSNPLTRLYHLYH